MSVLFGITGNSPVQDRLLSALHVMINRPFDSLGLCVLNRRRLKRVRAVGEIAALEALLPPRAMSGTVGIAHTRWASHGPIAPENTHPHTDTEGRVAVVHNGLLENIDWLCEQALSPDTRLASGTDSEIIAQLIAQSPGETLFEQTLAAVDRLRGTFGLLVIGTEEPGSLIAINHGSRIYVARNTHSCSVSSDPAVLAPDAEQIFELQDGESAILQPGKIRLHSITPGRPPFPDDQPTETTNLPETTVLAEMQQWPLAIRQTLTGRLDNRFQSARLDGLALDTGKSLAIRHIKLIGCGSSWHAARVGRFMIESLARIPASAEPAGEFLVRDPVISADTLYVIISQSGETGDSLAVIHELNLHQALVVAITNTISSAIATAAGSGIYLHAGVEQSVVATKSFGSTLTALALLSLHFARSRDLGPARASAHLLALRSLPEAIDRILAMQSKLTEVLVQLGDRRHYWLCGNGPLSAAAAEGAQKLTELTNLTAQSVSAAELNHGCISSLDSGAGLIWLFADQREFDRHMPQFESVLDTEVGLLIVLDETISTEALPEQGRPLSVIHLPETGNWLQAITHSALLQLLACLLAERFPTPHADRLRKSYHDRRHGETCA